MTVGNNKYCEEYGTRLSDRSRKKEAVVIEVHSVEQMELFDYTWESVQ